MARRDFLPMDDKGFLAFTTNFSRLINLTPSDFNLQVTAAAAYASQEAGFAAKLTAATEPETRGSRTVYLKDQAKQSLAKVTRSIAKQINNLMNVTDDQRQALGLTIASTSRQPVPVPSMQPVVTYVSINGRTVTIKLGRDQAKRGRPPKVAGATVFTAPMGTSLQDADSWSFLSSTTKTTVDVTFPAGGAQTVQITAFWTNARNESGPAGFPITVNLPASQQLPGEVRMKVAA